MSTVHELVGPDEAGRAKVGGMESWNRLMLRIRRQYGAGTVADALEVDVPQATWYRRTDAEGWSRPYPRVRVTPWVRPSALTDLSALTKCLAGSAASGLTAAWLQGLGDEPRVLTVLAPAGRSVPAAMRDKAGRCRWLRGDDVVLTREVPALVPEGTFLSLHRHPLPVARGYLIDALHRELTTLDRVAGRLDEVPGLAGRSGLARVIEELDGTRPESFFHAIVLEDLAARGYRPSPAPIRIPTPDGASVLPDIPLEAFRVAVETDGDRYHSGRDGRRRDRRRQARYAGTDWKPVPVDWKDWHEDPARVRGAIDGAILSQLRSGIGVPDLLPPHLQVRV